MDVILLERIPRLGNLGETVKVKNGFGRNFLLPQGKALRANEANKKRFELERANLEARSLERKNAATAIAEKLDGENFVFVRAAGETGQLYGSVSARDIADLISNEGHSVNKNHVVLNVPIKTIGIHTILVRMHVDVEATVTVNIARTKEEAERQAAGEKLDTAASIYGENEDKIVPSGMDHFGERDEI
jgi:large subunit ribosomal protein L9